MKTLHEMKTLKNTLFVVVGFAILVGALVLSGLQPQEAQSAPKAGATAPSDLVTLNSFHSQGVPSSSLPSPAFDCPGNVGFRLFQEFFPDGTTSGLTTPFSVPAGQVLVVTSVQVSMAAQLSSNIVFGLVRSRSVSATNIPVFSGVPIATNGTGSTNLTIPNGFVVPSGTDLCLLVAGVGSTTATVQGYLAKDK